MGSVETDTGMNINLDKLPTYLFYIILHLIHGKLVLYNVNRLDKKKKKTFYLQRLLNETFLTKSPLTFFNQISFDKKLKFILRYN